MTVRLQDTGLSNGIWRGLLDNGTKTRPDLVLSCNGELLADLPIEIEPAASGAWALSVRLPAELLSDGYQIFQLLDRASQDSVGQFVLFAGGAPPADLTAEVALLRAEVEMIKRALRQNSPQKHGK